MERVVTLIVYTNTAGNQEARDNDLFQIDAAGFLVDMGCVLVDHCSHAVNAASRVALQRAIRRIKPGDTLVVTRLGYLGSSISDAVSTLSTLAAKGAHVFCLDAAKPIFARAAKAHPSASSSLPPNWSAMPNAPARSTRPRSPRRTACIRGVPLRCPTHSSNKR